MTTTNEAGPGARCTGPESGAAVAVPVRADGRTAARRGERGMVSAEWAVGIIAAIGVAGVLLAVVTSGPVEEAILNFILLVIKAFARGI